MRFLKALIRAGAVAAVVVVVFTFPVRAARADDLGTYTDPAGNVYHLTALGPGVKVAPQTATIVRQQQAVAPVPAPVTGDGCATASCGTTTTRTRTRVHLFGRRGGCR